MSENAIVLEGLTKRFASLLAVDDVDLEVPVGSIFGLLGPNGAGKTTVIRILTIILRADRGRATVLGVDVARQPSALTYSTCAASTTSTHPSSRSAAPAPSTGSSSPASIVLCEDIGDQKLLARGDIAQKMKAMTRTDPLARHVVSWLFFVAGGIAVIASTIQTFTANPQQGEGWIGGPIQAVSTGGPLIAVGFGLRSDRRSVARKTAIASFLLALVVGFVLVMQILDANETVSDILVTCSGVVAYLAGFIVELPAFTDRWPPEQPIDTPDSRDRHLHG